MQRTARRLDLARPRRCHFALAADNALDADSALDTSWRDRAMGSNTQAATRTMTDPRRNRALIV